LICEIQILPCNTGW